MPTAGHTLFDTIWDDHRVNAAPAPDGGPDTLYIDLHLIHEVTSPQAFSILRDRGMKLRHPEQTMATMDHSTPSTPPGPDGRYIIENPDAEIQLAALERNCADFGVPLYPMGHANQGIVHVTAPELGLVQPGMTIVCGDSHTSTHGAFGALAFGIGTSQVAHVFATQCLLAKRPKTFEIRIDGALQPGSQRQGCDPLGDRPDRHRSRHRTCLRVHRQHHPGHVHGGTDDRHATCPSRAAPRPV